MLVIVESITVIVSSIAVVIGIIIAILQLQKMQVSNDLQQKSILADHERRKKQSTIEFSHQVLEERIKATDQINKVFKNQEVVNVTTPDYINNVNDVKGAISRYLNLMERISVGINIGVYDRDTFMRITGSLTIKFYRRIEPVIMEKRKKTGNPKAYCDFEQLVIDMTNAYHEVTPLIQSNNANIKHS